MIREQKKLYNCGKKTVQSILFTIYTIGLAMFGMMSTSVWTLSSLQSILFLQYIGFAIFGIMSSYIFLCGRYPAKTFYIRQICFCTAYHNNGYKANVLMYKHCYLLAA